MNRRWAERNPEKAEMAHNRKRARNAKAYQDNRQKWKERNNEFFRRHPGRRTIYARNYRLQKLTNGGSSSPSQIEARIRFYGGLCYICGSVYQHIDHVIPVSRGGSNWPANLRPICKSCNSRKSSLSLKEFRKRTT